MGTITPPNLIIGDAISSQPINTFIKSVNGFTVAADNIKSQGIDRRNIQSQITHDYNHINSDYTSANPITISSRIFKKFEDPFAGPISLPSLTIKKDQMFQVGVSFNFYTDENDTLNGNANGGFDGTPADLGPIEATFAIGADQQIGNIMIPIQFPQTMKRYRLISSTFISSSSKYHENANCCTMQVMDKATQDTTFEFYILGKASALGNSIQPKVFIDSLNFFYVRYLV